MSLFDLMSLSCCLLVLLVAAALVDHAAAIEVWFGTSPFCSSRSAYCDVYGLEFVRKDSVGSGFACLFGEKTLCQPRRLDKELTDTPKHDLTVVTYNAYEMPYTAARSGQAERTCRIPRALLNKFPETDVIIFNEVFLGGCIQDKGRTGADRRLSLKDLLEFYGFRHITDVVGESSRRFYNVNGGTLIASRWPISKTEEMVFKNYAGTDRFSAKGAVYAQVMKHGELYNVIGTHLQSWESHADVRLKQAAELSKFIKKLDIEPDQAVFIGGDFNSDPARNVTYMEALLTAMEAAMPTFMGDLWATYDKDSNQLVDDTQGEEGARGWLDYVVYSKVHKQPDRATMEAFKLKSDTEVTYCGSAPLQPYYVPAVSTLCWRAKSTRDLSDHYPVVARFSFNN